MRILVWPLAVGILSAGSGAGQERVTSHNVHGWYNYFGDHPVGGSKWGIHVEGQYRRHDVIRRWQQLLLRPGVNYQVHKNVLLTAGYAYIRSFPYGDYPTATAPTNEHRIWEQAWFRYNTGRVGWSTRVRFENRFLGSATTGRPYRYENRLRTWQQIRVPLQSKTYLTAYDEIWFYVKPYVSNSAFDQNRAYGAVGVQIHPAWRIEAGYMHQLILQRAGGVLESNHTLMISVFSTAPLARGGTR